MLRVSLGNFLFFTILALMMVGVKNQKDPRDGLHHGGWMMKIICWCLLVIFMFFLPNEIVSFYGKLFSSLDWSRKFFLLVSSIPMLTRHYYVISIVIKLEVLGNVMEAR